MEEITLNSTVTRNENLMSGIIDNEAVIMSTETGNYHVINETGRRIWELLEQPMTIAEVCSTISEDYDVDPNTCQNEVLKFIIDLFSRQIVVVL